MKILTIFVDMIRANRLSTFNNKVKVDTPLDRVFKELGGTIYNNCFTPGPDTPRGMSAYHTGVDPYQNGCNTRLKWPGPFLNKDLKTVYDLFLEENYEVDLFASNNEKTIGFFPEYIDKLNLSNIDHDIEKYLSNIKLKDNHFIFLGIPDYHWAFDDLGYTLNGEKESYEITKNTLDIIFEKLNKDDFDHIFIFSDHGFKFSFEMRRDSKTFLLNDDRTNIIMLHKSKEQNKLIINNKLCSLADMYPTYQELLKKDISNGISLFDKKERDFVISEDHLNFTPSVNQNIELWSLSNNLHIYIRTLDNAILIDRKTKNIEQKILNNYDKILKNNSSYGIYSDEYEKIFKYIEKIKLDDNLHYSNGYKRIKQSKLKRYFNIFLDILNKNLIRKIK